MPSIAITDSHQLFGAIDFYLSALKKGIKPIIGCELFFSPGGQDPLFKPHVRNSSSVNIISNTYHARYHHLVVLCKNMVGYENLCQMITQSYLNLPPPQKGAPSGQKAFVDRDLLSRFGEGLIVLSGCLKGELASSILQGELNLALDSVKWFHSRFKEDFYLELHESFIPEQDKVNEVLYEWSEKYKISCVAATDCHYICEEDAEAHEILQCIENGRNLDYDRPKSLVPSAYYLRSPKEMIESFKRFPGACENTVKIAEKCNLEFKFQDDKGRSIYHLPSFRPSGLADSEPFDILDFFKTQSFQGLHKRFQEPGFEARIQRYGLQDKTRLYEGRLQEELDMIEKTGFVSYFLIVADFINWAKSQGIPVGPGRGSGAGSLVAYALGITDIDPIAYRLLFERFINPERISMPDFDVDFCQERRNEVIQYVTQKYGKENVCQIITFGKLQARAVIRDVGRVLGLSFSETDAITKLFADELDITIQKAIDAEPKLQEKIAQEPKVAKTIQYAQKLEGLSRNPGVHAAGVIITEKPIVKYCPLYIGKDGGLVTQFDKDFAEKIGLIKFDFLGLKTLTVIDHAMRLIREENQDFDIRTISETDPKVFELISSGDTNGVFQVESSGMKDLCVRILPSSMEDLTAINALYRPGPLGSGMVDDYIDRKHGRKPILYDPQILSSILQETYGVILYQEQVMQIAREVAGYSLGQADLLRRAMGKKKPEEMAKHKEIFVKGAVTRGHPLEKSVTLFDLMAKFAEYGFNKSHSAAYAVLTYQTAFLKTHYIAEYMAALMAAEMDNTEKLGKYIADAKNHQISVLPPDINRSEKTFNVQRTEGKKNIRFGLEAIKGVGGVAVECILESRKSGIYQNILDFVLRVSTRKVNKKILESLTLSGALDCVAEINRASIFQSIEALLEHASNEQEEKALGQVSLFEAFKATEMRVFTPTAKLFHQVEDWPLSRKLSQEKQLLGFYVSGHPMDLWQKICDNWLNWNTEKIKNQVKTQGKPTPEESYFGAPFLRTPKQEIQIAGLMSELKEVTTKKGLKMAFVQLEDLYGKVEAVFFPETFTQSAGLLRQAIQEAIPILLSGQLEVNEENPKILAKSLGWANEAHEMRVSEVILTLNPEKISSEKLRELKKLLLNHRGKCRFRMCFTDTRFKLDLEVPKTLSISATPALVNHLSEMFGAEAVRLNGKDRVNG